MIMNAVPNVLYPLYPGNYPLATCHRPTVAGEFAPVPHRTRNAKDNVLHITLNLASRIDIDKAF
jgi:hypothetical protein